MQWSVIIPMGRPEKVIGTLESLASQTRLPAEWEIVLVGMHAKRVAWMFSRLPIKALDLDRLENPAATRNRGAAAAQGERLLFIDDDIELRSDYFEQLIELVGTDATGGVFAGKLPGKSKTVAGRLVDYANFWNQQIDERGERGWFYSAAFSVGADVFNETGGFNEAFAIGEDVDFTLRVRAAGYELRYEPKLVAVHNHGRSNLRKAFSYFIGNGKGAPFFARHAYATRCFSFKSAVSRAYIDYRTNKSLNGSKLKGFGFYAIGILLAYLVLQLSIEYHYQLFLLEKNRYREFPAERLSDQVLMSSYSFRGDKKSVLGTLMYSVAVVMSFFEPVRR